MVGCGPFPETLMNAYSRTDLFANIVGVDRCEASLGLARQIFPLCVKMEICRSADFRLADGTNYNYSNASAVLLANGLKNKKAIQIRNAFEKAGVDFTDGEGVKRLDNEVRIYKGPDSCDRFFDDLLQTAKEHNDDVSPG